MTPLVEVAERAARAGGAVVEAAHRERGFKVTTKSRADFVTEVDFAAERAIVDVIVQAFPDHAVLGEEGTTGGGGEGAPVRWVIDPLDGTTNFIRGIPFFAVAVAAERDGVPVAAAILEPLRGEMFRAVRGEGSFRDGERIRVSDEGDIGGAICCTGIPFRDLEPLERFLAGLERVARRSAGIRRMGSAALDLCNVACGRVEAFWEHGLSRWDVSAGSLLVEEAGGRVTDLAGRSGYLDSGDVVATNDAVHAALLRCVGE